jgi:hypothetical protein
MPYLGTPWNDFVVFLIAVARLLIGGPCASYVR